MKRSQIIIGAFVLAALCTVPIFAGTYYSFLAVLAFIYIIISIGLNILTGYAGLFSLGHAGLAAMGAYTTALLSKKLLAYDWLVYPGLNVILGILAGVTLACLVGALLAYPSLKTKGVYLAVVTISFGWIVWKILLEWKGRASDSGELRETRLGARFPAKCAAESLDVSACIREAVYLT